MTTISIYNPLSFTISNNIETFLDTHIDPPSSDRSCLSIKNVLVYSAAACGSTVNILIATVEIVASSTFALIAVIGVYLQKNPSASSRFYFAQSLAYCNSSKLAVQKMFINLFSPRSEKSYFQIKYSSLELCRETIKAYRFYDEILQATITPQIFDDMNTLKHKFVKLLINENKSKSYPDSAIIDTRLDEIIDYINTQGAFLNIPDINTIERKIKSINSSEIPRSAMTKLVPNRFINYIFNFTSTDVETITSDIVQVAYNMVPELFFINEEIDPLTGKPLENINNTLQEKITLGKENISSLHPSALYKIANLVELIRQLPKDADLKKLTIFEKEFLIARLLTIEDSNTALGKLPSKMASNIKKLECKICSFANSLLHPIDASFSEGYQNALTTF